MTGMKEGVEREKLQVELGIEIVVEGDTEASSCSSSCFLFSFKRLLRGEEIEEEKKQSRISDNGISCSLEIYWNSLVGFSSCIVSLKSPVCRRNSPCKKRRWWSVIAD